jgi:predicted dehydrogenase/threonine dehydrogenase-like Zn-dependent dehydrogenase
MKQLVQNLRTGETTVQEVPIPQLKPGMALIKTAISLVSAGTERMLVDFASKSLLGKVRSRPDLARQVIDKARREGLLTSVESAFNRLDQPLALGYSSAGTISALGEGLQGFKVGQRVACGGGGYAVHAEYALVPHNLIVEIPPEVDFESAAFTTLGAIALHGFRLARPALGEQVTVIGLGLLGLLTVAIANAAGCRVLGLDLDPERVKLAEGMGAHAAVSRDEAEQAALSLSRGRGSDIVLICADTSSSDPVELAGDIARDRGRVVAIGAVGLQIPRKVYYEKELSFINSRSYGPGRYDSSYEEGGLDYPIGYVRWTEGRNFEAFLDLLSSGRVDVKPLITHRFSIHQAPSAYQLITGESSSTSLGVLLTYDSEGVSGEAAPEKAARRIKVATRDNEQAQTEKHASIQLGVLGAGNFASAVMLPAIKKVPEIALVGVASGSGLSAQNVAKRFNFAYAASDENQVINDPAINTVAILTRHNLHARQVIAALQAGKHVFCEKPLALNSHELDEIFAEIRSAGSQTGNRTKPLITVGFNRRFAPFSRLLKEFFDNRQEALFLHYLVNAGPLPLDHWLHDPQQGGGRLIGEACHFIDLLTFLVGEPPTSVSAFSLPDNGKYQEDNFHLTLIFPNGSIGTVDYLANGDKVFPKERLEVFSGEQVGVIDDFRSLALVRGGKRQIKRSRLRQDKGHRATWDAFVRAITAGAHPPIPYNQLYGVTQATFAAQEALRTGEEVRITSWVNQ